MNGDVMTTQKTEFPIGRSMQDLEEVGPPYRVCDEAYVGLRRILKRNRLESDHFRQPLHRGVEIDLELRRRRHRGLLGCEHRRARQHHSNDDQERCQNQ